MDLILNEINIPEALRYMGCPPNGGDAGLHQQVQACAKTLLRVLQPRYIYKVFALAPNQSGVLLDCGLALPGKDLATHLSGCHQAALLCVTLSAGVDRYIRQAQATDITQALMLDACATAATEQACDLAQAEIMAQYPGCNFPFRFSPGYGDLPLTLQQDILTVLDANRRIGVCATANSILTPRKSVTAVLGISHGPVPDQKRGCATCNMRGRCQFGCRKEKKHE